MSINKVVITGNLTRDAEVRTTSGGTTVSNIGVAVNDRVRNSSTGEWEDYANFINCVIFGKRAEGISPYLKKGMKVAIEGRLRYSAWETEGQKRNKIEVIVDEIELMSSRQGGSGTQATPGREAFSAPDTPVINEDSSVYDEDVPF